MAGFLYEFEWDRGKAKANFMKHGVFFQLASQVFRDPLALTIPDEDHSELQDRWITVGIDTNGRYVLVVHTFDQVKDRLARVRLISARRPTKVETDAYEEER